jgi:uncharacterized protein
MMRLFFILLILSGLFLLFIYLIQRSLIYLPDRTRPELNKSRNAGVEEIHLTTSDGISLLSWYKPARKGQPTMLYLQGNAGNIGARAKLVHPYLDQGYGILLLGYQGYGGNAGKPTEQHLYQDVWAGWNFLSHQGVSNDCIVLVGESLGTALAINLASQQKVGAVILIAPFTSMLDLGTYHYPFLPVKLLLKDRFDSIAKISNIKAPILIFVAEHDTVVPSKFSQRIFNAANEPKELVEFKNINHNELPSIISERVISFLTKQLSCKEGQKGHLKKRTF